MTDECPKQNIAGWWNLFNSSIMKERRDLMRRHRADRICDRELALALSIVIALIHHPERQHVVYSTEAEAKSLMDRLKMLLTSYGLPTDLLHSVESRIPPAVQVGVDWGYGSSSSATFKREPDGRFFIVDEP